MIQGISDQFPLIMGILNISPDSFYKDSCIKYNKVNSDLLKYSNIIDVGCESTRPYSNSIDLSTELGRLEDFIYHYEIENSYLSIDTYKPEVAKFSLDNGFSMINDIKGGGDDNSMLYLAAEYDCPIVLMHMKGQPSSMQNNPSYIDVIDEIIYFFEKKIKIADDIGIDKKKIILDPGIGFGKRIQDNDRIIMNLDKIKKLGFTVLVGLSRKSFLSIESDVPENRLPSTIAASVLALQNGADILRVHDTMETFKVIETLKRLEKNRTRELNEV